MKIDDRSDALRAAGALMSAPSVEGVATALLEAHLEGIEQGRSLLLQGRTFDQVLDELSERRKFLLKQIRGQ